MYVDMYCLLWYGIDVCMYVCNLCVHVMCVCMCCMSVGYVRMYVCMLSYEGMVCLVST